MRVRPAAAGDVAAVGDLERRLFGVDAWSPSSVAEELTGPARSSVVASDDAGRVVGYAVVLAGPDVLDVQRIGVEPAHRRTGVGRRLLAAAVAAAAGGAQRVMLEVRAEDAGARAFYEAAGFEMIDRRPRYYRDGADALVMSALTVRVRSVE